MDRYAKTKKGMNIQQKTRVKVAGLINDLHLLQSLPGMTKDVSKNYRLGNQYFKYLRELDVIDTKDGLMTYSNPKNHSTEYILDYVMSRYECEYGKEIKAETPSDKPKQRLIDVDLTKPRRYNFMDAAIELEYKLKHGAEIRNLQSDLNRQEAYIHTLKNEIKKKEEIILSLTKKKSIFARIKNLLS